MRMNKSRENLAAVTEASEKKTAMEKGKRALRSAYALGMAGATFAGSMTAVAATAFADGDGDIKSVMKEVGAYMEKVCKWVGIGIIVFGIYEVGMAFLQQAPEQKTKGIMMVVVGGCMTGLGAFASKFANGGGSAGGSEAAGG